MEAITSTVDFDRTYYSFHENKTISGAASLHRFGQTPI
jgi:hypothetical protein